MNIEKGRLGQFFIFMGLVLLLIFFTTDQAKNPSYGLFFLGAIGVLFGGYLIWRGMKPAAPVERFRGIHRWQARRREKEAKRLEAKAAKQQKKK